MSSPAKEVSGYLSEIAANPSRTEQHVREVRDMRMRAAETVLTILPGTTQANRIAAAILALQLFPDDMNQRGNR